MFLYCNHKVHRDFLITLFIVSHITITCNVFCATTEAKEVRGIFCSEQSTGPTLGLVEHHYIKPRIILQHVMRGV
jgi:hypothetical protein